MTEWVKREYGKGLIDRAGHLLVPWWKGGPKPEELGRSYIIIQNWRTSHALPLNVFQAVLRSRAKRVEERVIVAQRLKRFSSIMAKLVREPSMKLSQMQDLGGCRAILSSVREVDDLYAMYRGNDPLFADATSVKCYDYLRHPKPDGYRGIHVVGRYNARSIARESWNGHRIELQLRTRLQHAFATTVETVTTFTRSPLKFGSGPTEWRRSFSLMGSALAVRESTSLVSDTPTDYKELIQELRECTKALKVRERLRGWADALRALPRSNLKGFKWILLVLDTKAHTIRTRGYSVRQEAAKAIEEIEQSKQEELDAVLVWVGSISDLRAAYPNYYADTKEFIEALNVALATFGKR
jgi:(p)ppGpp synthase/HD superfamily hydrolase